VASSLYGRSEEIQTSTSRRVLEELCMLMSLARDHERNGTSCLTW